MLLRGIVEHDRIGQFFQSFVILDGKFVGNTIAQYFEQMENLVNIFDRGFIKRDRIKLCVSAHYANVVKQLLFLIQKLHPRQSDILWKASLYSPLKVNPTRHFVFIYKIRFLDMRNGKGGTTFILIFRLLFLVHGSDHANELFVAVSENIYAFDEMSFLQPQFRK